VKYLFILTLICVAALSVAAQDKGDKTTDDSAKQAANAPPPAPLTPTQKRAVELDKKERAQEVKERQKHPPETDINASPEKVAAIIVSAMAQDNWTIADEGKYQLVFTQEIGGFGGAFAQAVEGAGSERPKRVMRFIITPRGDGSHLLANFSVAQRGTFGRVTTNDFTKKQWENISTLLNLIRTKAEAQ
jgi:hypothetical protein